MLGNIYAQLNITSSIAIIIISIALMLFTGFAITRITKLFKLPNVTAYIISGIILGPYCLDLIPSTVISGTDFLPDIALAFISFGVGEYFNVAALRKNGLKVLCITVLSALFASVLVFSVCYFALGIEISFSIVLAALASATAPASTVMTIRQTGAKGDFVDTLLEVIALGNIISLVAFSVSLSISVSVAQGVATDFFVIIKPVLINIAVLALGGLFGYFMKLLMPKKRSNDNRLIISIALLFAFCGICAVLDVSPLLGCMSMGMVYINITKDDNLFKQLNYFSPPLLLLFFVRSGLSFNLGAFSNSGQNVGWVPVYVVVILYFIVRVIGKYAGAYLGYSLIKKDNATKKYLGLGLIPQAGVAIGLAALGARTLGGQAGENLQTIILAVSVLYELIGPACAKYALFKTKSYSTKLEDLAPVSELRPDGTQKTIVELITEQIERIQKELPPKNEISPEEQAFDEAAARQYDSYENMHRGKFINRRKN